MRIWQLLGGCLLATATFAAPLRADEVPPTSEDDAPSAPDDDAPPPNDADDAPPPRAPHPEPRVIVRVLRVDGPHDRSEVERAARLGWGRIVRCYKAQRKRVRGSVVVDLTIDGDGAVTRSRRARTTLDSGELASCLTKSLKSLAMPKAARGSSARIDIWVGPGDAS